MVKFVGIPQEIRLGYAGTSRLIANATAGGKTWTYQYRPSTYRFENWMPISGLVRGKVLNTVVQPDGYAWQFNLDRMSASPAPTGRSECIKARHTVSLTHPYGLTGTFDIEDSEHRHVFSLQTRRQEFCIDSEPLPGTGGPSGSLPLDNNITTSTMSVVRKTLSGPGLEIPLVWVYRYERDQSASGSSSADRTNWTEVTAPEAHYTYYHAWVSEPLSGRLIRKDTRRQAGGAVLRSEVFTYEQEAALGSSHFIHNPGPQDVNKPVHAKKQTIHQQGDQYHTEYAYTTLQSDSKYSYGFPISKTLSSSVATAPRKTETTYLHDRTKWNLGLPTVVKIGGRLTKSYQYNSQGRPIVELRHGLPYATYGYNTDGTMAWAKDAMALTHYARDYSAGVPQTVERPDGTTYRQQVDEFGRLSQVTDAKGATTYYDRDAAGRLQRVQPPSP